MEWAKDRIDKAMLALLQFTLHDGCRAWVMTGTYWAACTRRA